MAPEKREENKMLDQLVESKSNSQENTRKSGFLLTTFVFVIAVLLSGWVYSLFARIMDLVRRFRTFDFGCAGSGCRRRTAAAEPEKPQEKQQVEKAAAQMWTMRTEIIQRMDRISDQNRLIQ